MGRREEVVGMVWLFSFNIQPAITRQLDENKGRGGAGAGGWGSNSAQYGVFREKWCSRLAFATL